MSKGISSYGSNNSKKVVVRRRLAQPESNRGLGYWSAFDAQRHIDKEVNDEEPEAGSEAGRE